MGRPHRPVESLQQQSFLDGMVDFGEECVQSNQYAVQHRKGEGIGQL